MDDTTKFSNADLSTYVSVVFLQTSYEPKTKTTTKIWYNSTACNNSMPQAALVNLLDYYCVDIPYTEYNIAI